jgi:hypothetical protein
MEHPSLQYAECPTAMKSCRDIDRKGEAEELYEAVRAAVDPSVSVRWHEEDWSVTVDYVVVGSVEEALEVTGGEA